MYISDYKNLDDNVYKKDKAYHKQCQVLETRLCARGTSSFADLLPKTYKLKVITNVMSANSYN